MKAIHCTSKEVKDYLDGTKSMFRMPLRKPLQYVQADSHCYGDAVSESSYFYGDNDIVRYCLHSIANNFTRYKVGERIYVKEAWVNALSINLFNSDCIVYKAQQWENETCINWEKSTTMTRKMSRITLEITNVRVERVGDVGDYDCRREGIVDDFISNQRMSFCDEQDRRREIFGKSWDKKYGRGKYKWNNNCWAEVYSVKVVKGE